MVAIAFAHEFCAARTSFSDTEKAEVGTIIPFPALTAAAFEPIPKIISGVEVRTCTLRTPACGCTTRERTVTTKNSMAKDGFGAGESPLNAL